MIACLSTGDETMKRLLLAGMLFALLLPALDAQNSTALAGRTLPGSRWCECGDQSVPNCVCDPGEQPCTACPSQGLTVQQNAEQESDLLDLGATFSLVIGAAFLVLRLRQLL